MIQFILDTVTPACQEVLDAIVAANSGLAESYGDDAWTIELQGRFSEFFEKEVTVFPTVSGTASNDFLGRVFLAHRFLPHLRSLRSLR